MRIVILAAGLFVSHQLSAEELLVVESADLETYWKKTTQSLRVNPEYPSETVRERGTGCVKVGYVIESDGTTSTHRIIKADPGGNSFDQASLRAVARWRYEPSESNQARDAVFTTIILTYKLHPSTAEDQASIRARCIGS